MIDGLEVRELTSRLYRDGYTVEIWREGEAPKAHLRTSLHHVFPGRVEAWFRRERAAERIVCLRGMIKLVLCDRRTGSVSPGRVMELYLGEQRFREVIVPAGVLRGWKAVGDEPALVLLSVEGEAAEAEHLDREEAQVPYDWAIMMR